MCEIYGAVCFGRYLQEISCYIFLRRNGSQDVYKRQGKNRYFVRELETGYVVIGDYQRIKGYTLFLCKVHATEIHFLERPFRETFLNEMSLVAEAVYNAFGPDKLNYELLGQGENVHMH